MPWKTFIIQSVVLLSLSFLAAQYFSLNHLNSIRFQQEDMAAEIKDLREQLLRIEQQTARSASQPPAQGAFAGTAGEENRGKNKTRESKAGNVQISLLQQQIQNIAQQEYSLEERMDSLVTEQERLVQLQKQSLPEHVKVRNWLTSLPEEKKSVVQEIYRKQSEMMLANVSADPQAVPPTPEDMLSLLQESRKGLKDQLKEVLNQQEYQAFLESLGTEAVPTGLPPLPR